MTVVPLPHKNHILFRRGSEYASIPEPALIIKTAKIIFSHFFVKTLWAKRILIFPDYYS
jgi:hypothetical protein